MYAGLYGWAMRIVERYEMSETVCVLKQNATDLLTATMRHGGVARRKTKSGIRHKVSFLFYTWLALTAAVFAPANRASAQVLYVSDMTAGAVYRLDASGQTLIADGLGQPHGLAVDSTGNIYVAEVAGDRIRRIRPDGVMDILYSFDSQIDNPEGVAIGPDGAVYVSGTIDHSSYGLKKIYRIDPETGLGTIYASAGLQECLDLDFDAAGNLYVADLASTEGGIIWKVTPDGQSSRFVTGLGPITGLAVAPDGETLYASSGFSDEVWRVDRNGQAELYASMSLPWAMTFDNSGHLYVGDGAGGQIIQFDSDGAQNVFASGFGSVRGMDVHELATLSLLMDIRPGSDSNPVNSKSNGVLPVAIYGTDDIDVTEIDLATLMLEGMSLRERGNSGKLGTFEDINGDSIVDLLLHFEMSELSFNASSDEYTLSGMMLDGMALEGSDSIRSVPHGVVFADPDTLAASLGNAAGGATIPEPASLSLLAIGGLAMLRRRSAQVLRRRR